MLFDVDRGANERERYAMAASTARRKNFTFNARYFVGLRVIAIVVNVVDSRLGDPVSRFVRHNFLNARLAAS